MAKDNGPRKLLSSWKEVAAYLGCDKRTCYRWEKTLGLPVRRVEGASRSRVFAYAEEIDRWREERLRVVPGPGDRPAPKVVAKVLPFIGLASVGLVAALIFLPKVFASRRPSDFHIRGSVLSILDDKGRELWRHDTGVENLSEESRYRSHFQFRRQDDETGAELLPHLVIKDLDGDGRPEVLFSTQTQDEWNEGELICFGPGGEVRWKVRTGREMRFGEKDFSADYRINGFDVADLDGDGHSEIVVVSIHRPNFPCQLLVLDHAGKSLGEYWNSGHINDIVIHDLDGDGKPEIIAGGANNESRSSFLAVFRPDRVGGASPQSRDEYTSPGLDPGTQEFYVLVPRTEVDALLTQQDAVEAIAILKSGRISALMYNSGLYYEFGFDFGTMEVRSSHKFERLFARAAADGAATGVVDAAYLKGLKDRTRFWNGTGWAPPPE